MQRGTASRPAHRRAELPREEAFAIPDIIRTATNLLPPDVEVVRIVDIVGLDLQADGGTHVASTSQVGAHVGGEDGEQGQGLPPPAYRHRRLMELWTCVDVVPRTGSTNADLLARGGPEGQVLVAEEQTAGRGRMGRSWMSQPGASLTFSVLLRPVTVPPARRGWLPLLTGVAVATAVRSVAAVPRP